eukprot:5058438-Lingulodinium_polyedra.AAC.1
MRSPGSAKTQLGAAEIASAAWGIPLKSLEVARGHMRRRRAKQSKFAIVHWHTRRGMWYAQHSGTGGYLGHYK